MMKRWYEALFENYSGQYDQESFTLGTLGEVDFIEREINGDKTKRILDLGCGTGRHSLELASRGYQVVGVDLSASQLQRAREKAAQRGVRVNFIQQDARSLHLDATFDLVIMLCEAGFSLMETDEMNYAILQSAARSLAKEGKIILSCLNALYPLYHSVKDLINADATATSSVENHFDLLTFRDRSTIESIDDNGHKRILECDERYYAPCEISWLLKSLGFKTVEIFGCPLGRFSRDVTLTTDDYEMLVVAEKYLNNP